MNRIIFLLVVVIIIHTIPNILFAGQVIQIQNHSFITITEDANPNNRHSRQSMFIKNEDCTCHYTIKSHSEGFLGEGEFKVEMIPVLMQLGDTKLKIICIPNKIIAVNKD